MHYFSAFFLAAGVLLPAAFVNAQTEESVFKVSGDIRYRHQSLKTGDSENDPIQYIRARMGVEGTVNDETKAIFQVGTFGTGSRDSSSATGDFSTTPGQRSSNQAMGQGGKSEKWTTAITQAHIRHQSTSLQGLTLSLGKMSNPLYYAGKSQIVFDSDIYPEGMYVGYQHPLAEDHSLYVNFVNFVIQSLYNPTASPQEDIADHYVTASQFGWKGRFSDYQMILGVGQTRFPTANANVGKAMILNEASLEFGGPMGRESWSWSLYAHYLTNSKQDEDNKAQQYGLDFKFDKMKLGFASVRNEANSVASAFSDGDIGGADKSSTIAKFSAEIGKGLELGLTNYSTKTALDPASGVNANQTRTQIDLLAKF